MVLVDVAYGSYIYIRYRYGILADCWVCIIPTSEAVRTT
jgi:hypothetical protein